MQISVSSSHHQSVFKGLERSAGVGTGLKAQWEGAAGRWKVNEKGPFLKPFAAGKGNRGLQRVPHLDRGGHRLGEGIQNCYLALNGHLAPMSLGFLGLAGDIFASQGPHCQGAPQTLFEKDEPCVHPLPGPLLLFLFLASRPQDFSSLKVLSMEGEKLELA